MFRLSKHQWELQYMFCSFGQAPKPDEIQHQIMFTFL